LTQAPLRFPALYRLSLRFPMTPSNCCCRTAASVSLAETSNCSALSLRHSQRKDTQVRSRWSLRRHHQDSSPASWGSVHPRTRGQHSAASCSGTRSTDVRYCVAEVARRLPYAIQAQRQTVRHVCRRKTRRAKVRREVARTG